MRQKLLLLTLVAAVVLIVIAMKLDEPVAGAVILFILVSLFVLQLRSSSTMKPCRDVSELDDDDGGIDWREENAPEEDVAMWKGWAVLMDDVAVHEAKAAAESLEKAQISCRLELLKEDRDWHRFGNGGLGTRMCVLVAPGDFAAARKIV